MHLALIPDDKTIEALRRFAPQLPSDPHCTIIHAKRKLGALKLPLPDWAVAGSYFVGANGLHVFGYVKKVRVLILHPSRSFKSLHAGAEGILRDAGIAWSAERPFSPHVTLGSVGDELCGDAPQVFGFSRLKWR